MDNVTSDNNSNIDNNQPQPIPVSASPEVKIVGVRFKRAGRIYYFDPKDMELKLEDWVIVETTRGMEIGRVAITPEQVLTSEVELPLKPVLRKADAAEAKHTQETQNKEHEALVECGKIIARLNLPMKLL